MTIFMVKLFSWSSLIYVFELFGLYIIVHSICLASSIVHYIICRLVTIVLH